METFEGLERRLLALEERHVKKLAQSFVCTQPLESCITGQVQFAAIDPRHKTKEQQLPVVVLIGINYTQDATPGYELRHYLGTLNEPSVTQKAGCITPTALVIAAYNRNIKAWVSPRAQLYDNCDILSYGARDATLRSGLTGTDGDTFKNGFHLIVTNFCPFITRLMWREQAERNPDECSFLLRNWSSERYLDRFNEEMGESVDLWIGHAAKDRTSWVWPRFMDFVNRHGIKEWLLTPNINGLTSANFVRHFRGAGHKLLPLFAP